VSDNPETTTHNRSQLVVDGQQHDDVDAIINSVTWGYPWTLDGFIAGVGAKLDLQINRMATDLGSVSGYLLVTRRRKAYLVHHSDASAPEANHIAAHELGHLVWGDATTDGGLPLDALQSLLPSISADNLIQAAGRTCYDDPSERRAELFAYRLHAIIDHHQRQLPPPPTDTDRRLRATFSSRWS